MRKSLRLPRTVLACGLLAACVPASTAGAVSRSHRLAFLLGHVAVEKQLDREAARSAEAFPFTSASNGTARRLHLYVDRANRASTARVAIYSTVHGHPGRLLTAGSTRRHVRHGWNQIAVRGARLHRGQRYWIAVLGIGGTLAYRDRRTSGCRSQNSAHNDLVRFPARWTPGPAWPTCMLSAYVTGQPGSSGRPNGAKHSGTSGTPPAGSPPGAAPLAGSTPPGGGGGSSPAPSGSNCAGPRGSRTVSQSSLDACGLPSMNTTGPPAGTHADQLERLHRVDVGSGLQRAERQRRDLDHRQQCHDPEQQHHGRRPQHGGDQGRQVA